MTKKRDWHDIILWAFIVGFIYNAVAAMIIDDHETLRQMAVVGSIIGVVGLWGMRTTRQLWRRIAQLNRESDVAFDNFRQSTETLLERVKQAQGEKKDGSDKSES